MEDQEKQEIREIYSKKGFKDELLEEIVRIITSRRKVWVDTMMREELGLVEEDKRPLDSSVSTFVGFNLIGLIPLIPFIILVVAGIEANSDAFSYSTISVLLSFFIVGIIKGKIVKKSKLRSGLFTLNYWGSCCNSCIHNRIWTKFLG